MKPNVQIGLVNTALKAADLLLTDFVDELDPVEDHYELVEFSSEFQKQLHSLRLEVEAMSESIG